MGLCPIPRAVHPRMRGERPPRPVSGRPRGGSSPHARGTPGRAAAVARLGRFIPACAGNAARARWRPGLLPVHPRMRGERASGSIGRPWWPGSSPHARGTRLRRDRAALVARFIPACAGNATQGWTPPCPSAVHPRMRGERLHQPGVQNVSLGSSPHARGTRIGRAE